MATDLENNLIIKLIDKIEALQKDINDLTKKVDLWATTSNNHFNIDNSEIKKDSQVVKELGMKILEKLVDRISDDKLNNVIDTLMKFTK